MFYCEIELKKSSDSQSPVLWALVLTILAILYKICIKTRFSEIFSKKIVDFRPKMCFCKGFQSKIEVFSPIKCRGLKFSRLKIVQIGFLGSEFYKISRQMGTAENRSVFPPCATMLSLALRHTPGYLNFGDQGAKNGFSYQCHAFVTKKS